MLAIIHQPDSNLFIIQLLVFAYCAMPIIAAIGITITLKKKRN